MFLRRIPTRFITAILLLIAMFAGLTSGWSYTPVANAQVQLEQNLSQKAGELSETLISDKISDDIELEMASAVKTQMVSVIVQTKAAPKAALSAAVAKAGGLVKRTYTNFNVLAMDMPSASLRSFAARSDVSYISLDRVAQVTGHLEDTTGTSLVRSTGLLSPELNGAGIGIAILDSGIFGLHVAFQNSGTTSRVVTNVNFASDTPPSSTYRDQDGHGTHCAGLAAGNGKIAGGAYEGIASAANLIDVRVLNAQGAGTTSAVLAGIDWCIANKNTYNIKVMNLSLGTTAVDSYKDDPLCQAVRRAVDAGIVVCVAAGNLGKDEQGNKVMGAIHSPGIEPSAITVGAAVTKGTNYRGDDGVATYSSRGPTRGYQTINGVKNYDNLIKPDLIAPGNKLISAEAPNNRRVLEAPGLHVNVSSNVYRKQMRMSGTSMATPVVAGTAALLLQKNPGLTPNLVKALLMYSAQPLAGFNTLEQGAGLLNVEGAVKIAGLVKPNPSTLTLGAPLLTGPAPVQISIIAGQTFQWSGGLIMKWNFITGSDLITKYQGIYGIGGMLTDGVVFSDSQFLANGVVLTDAVVISPLGVVFSDGTTLEGGDILGVVLTDTIGVVLTDGVIIGDGVVISDSLLENTLASLLSLDVPGSGDPFAGPDVIEEDGLF